MKPVLDESDRLIFSKAPYVLRRGFYRRIAIFGLVLISLSVLLYVGYSFVNFYTNIHYQKGVADGRKQALETAHPSEELEIACAGLWVGEQNRKYFRK